MPRGDFVDRFIETRMYTAGCLSRGRAGKHFAAQRQRVTCVMSLLSKCYAEPAVRSVWPQGVAFGTDTNF